MSTPSPHILVVPFPAQGHMLPLLDLTHQLSLRALTITILVTPKNLPLLTPLLTLHPSIRTLVLPFPTHPSIPFPSGVENVKQLPHRFFRPMIVLLGELYTPLLHWFRSNPSPPTAILSDFFFGWTHHLAAQLGIPRINFSPSGALAFLFMDYLFRELPKNAGDDNALIPFTTIPNSPSFSWCQFSYLYRTQKEGDPESEFIRNVFLVNSESWGFIVNSFDELESVYLLHMKKAFKNQHIWAVGPLIPPNDGFRDGDCDGDVLSWLDTCPDNSVVYVCFGSQVVLNNKQMEAMATGLEQSGARFVWCAKEPTREHEAGEYGKMPDGFEDRTAARGLVIKGWAPQVMILRHKAVGAFLTHCGWNSVMEAIVAGVPMLTWPMTADQYADAVLLVDELGVAVRVCEGGDAVPDVGQLARKVVESVSGDSEERMRVLEMRNAALGAVKQGGKSWKDLDDFVGALRDLTSGNE